MLWCFPKKISLKKKHTSKISQVRMAHILCILAILCFASCVAEKTETEQGLKDLQLRQDSLAWLGKLQDKQVRCLYFLRCPSPYLPNAQCYKNAPGPRYDYTAGIGMSCKQSFNAKSLSLLVHTHFIYLYLLKV